MFLVRQAQQQDADILLKLAKMVHFINLPADKDVIRDKIMRSRASFEAARSEATFEADESRSGAGRSPLHMFVMEESSTGNALGTSSVIAKMGTPGNPNIAMQLRRRELFSRDLQQGVTHVTAQLVQDEDGPTEIGGLILSPSYRGHPAKLGMQLSLVRFHYMGLHRDRFEDRLLAEMMGALTAEGGNTLWEYFGRRFINLSYTEADRFCAYSREFMTSLLPHEEIYLTLLPPEARSLIGQVGPETKPARAMLEKLGFRYDDRCDPFDGGPHLEAKTDDIEMIRSTKRMPAAGAIGEDDGDTMAFVSVERDEEEFRAVYTPCTTTKSGVRLPEAVMEALGVREGDEVGFTAHRKAGRESSKGERSGGSKKDKKKSRRKATA